MGQKIHPTGFRIGVNKSHDAKWYSDYSNYGQTLKEDYLIRQCIEKKWGSLYTKSGDVVGAAGTVLVDALAPKEQIWITQQTLVEKFGPDWSEVAMLEIHSGSGVKLINLNYSSQQETFFNFSCSEGGSELERIYLQTSSLSENESLSHIINTSSIVPIGDKSLLLYASIIAFTSGPRSSLSVSSKVIIQETMTGKPPLMAAIAHFSVSVS